MRCPRLAFVVIPTLTFLFTQSLSAKDKSGYGIGSFAKYVEIAGATRVGSDTCVQCHANVANDFKHAFHAQQGVECEDCHGPGSLHAGGNGDVAKIIGFRSRPVKDANGVCLSCHIQNAGVRHWLTGPHEANSVRCTDCHQVHAVSAQGTPVRRVNFETASPGHATFVEKFVPESGVMLDRRSAMTEACLKCHQTQRAQMQLPYHHPLREGKMDCVDCHDPHGGPAGNNLRVANANQLCLSCHAQYRGPFMYQHPPVNENCLNCHSPHGSPNTNMLTLSEPALCLQCHIAHHDGAGLPLVDRCTNCHNTIHGSDVPTATGGSRFLDKGGNGVPSVPPQPAVAQGLNSRRAMTALAPVAAHTPMMLRPRMPQQVLSAAPAGILSRGYLSPVPSHPPVMSLMGMAFPAAIDAPMGAFPGSPMGAFPGGMSAMGAPTGSSLAPNSYWGLYFTPGAYRFRNVTGYGGRVGEYDSLQSAYGGDFEGDYVSLPHHMSLLSRGTVLTGSDFDFKSRLTVGDGLEVGGDLRSFVEQQDNYPFLSATISPDITVSDGITPGTVYGVKRRMGDAYARLKVPKLPVHLFVRGGWQARVGQTQLRYLDENTNNTCGQTCHYNSQYQRQNYTTRDLGGGMEVNVHGVVLTYEHDYSSFNDRLPFPVGQYGPMLNGDEPNPNPVIAATVADVPAGNYYLSIPSPNRYSADLVSINWTASPKLVFNGQATYRRARDVFTNNPQNAFDANATLSWHPSDRLRITGDYRQQNMLNAFVPYYAYFGNMSYHQYWVGLKGDYELSSHFDLEPEYEYSGITRSNAFLWPQVYSFDNTDKLPVVAASSSNKTGLALHYHSSGHLNARAGYERIGTNNPGYLIIPKNNNRIFGDVTLTPNRWLAFTNDASIIVQNGFQVIQRRDRFYSDTASATLTPVPSWTLALGYSYQQDNLATYMGFQHDAAAGYVVDDPFVPYRQLSQTYWFQSGYKFKDRLGLNLSIAHSSAHSGMRPDVNPNNFLLLGNGPLVQDGTFLPDVFQQALQGIAFGSQATQVEVPQFIGQGKVYYLLPHGLDAGVLIYYGSYRDYTNPNLNGILRSCSIYVGRSW